MKTKQMKTSETTKKCPVPIAILPSLFDNMFTQCGKHGSDVLALYLFYYCQARKHGTNQPWATNSYAAKGLRWGISKVKAVKPQLLKLGLIENVRRRSPQGRIKWYVKVNFVWSTSTCMDFIPPEDASTGMENHRVENHTTSALSVKRGSALSEVGVEEEERHSSSTTTRKDSNFAAKTSEDGLRGSPDKKNSTVASSTGSSVGSKSAGFPSGMVMTPESIRAFYKEMFGQYADDAMSCDTEFLEGKYGKADLGKHIANVLSKLILRMREAYRVFVVFSAEFHRQNGSYPVRPPKFLNCTIPEALREHTKDIVRCFLSEKEEKPIWPFLLSYVDIWVQNNGQELKDAKEKKRMKALYDAKAQALVDNAPSGCLRAATRTVMEERLSDYDFQDAIRKLEGCVPGHRAAIESAKAALTIHPEIAADVEAAIEEFEHGNMSLREFEAETKASALLYARRRSA